MKVQESITEIQSQLDSILNCLDNHKYALQLDAFSGSSIGKHVRHIFDFYACIVNGSQDGQLDYNDRERNNLIEEDLMAAKVCFEQLSKEIKSKDTEQTIMVVTDFSTISISERPIVNSTIGRELMYAFDHAIHHIAIIKMGIKATYPEIKIPNHIGVAPSTIKYHSKN